MIRLTRTSSNPPAASRLDGSAVFLRPPQTDEWAAWAELRAESRQFLTPWEPTWPPDALNESAYLRRVRRLATEWKTDDGYSFHVFQKERGCLVGGIGLTQVKRGGRADRHARLLGRRAVSGPWLHHRGGKTD